MKDSHIHSGLIEHTYDDIFSIAEKAKEIGLSEITILEHFSPFKIKYPSNSDKSNTIFIDKIPKAYLRRTSIIKQLIKECNLSEKKIGIKIFLVPVGEGYETNYLPEKTCSQHGSITFCTTKYKSEKVNISESTGIEVKEVATINDALKYFIS